jgi:hypothetical protein
LHLNKQKLLHIQGPSVWCCRNPHSIREFSLYLDSLAYSFKNSSSKNCRLLALFLSISVSVKLLCLLPSYYYQFSCYIHSAKINKIKKDSWTTVFILK